MAFSKNICPGYNSKFPFYHQVHPRTAIRSQHFCIGRLLLQSTKLLFQREWWFQSQLVEAELPYSKVGNSFSSHCHSANANQLKSTMDSQNVPIKCHWSLCVLEWSSCHLDQWRANARIVHQLSEMGVHSGATLPQPNLTAKHQVSGLILWPVSAGDRWC